MPNTSIEKMNRRPRVLESCQTTLWNPISDSLPYYSRRNRSQSHHLWWKTDQTLFTTCSNWKPSDESLRKLLIRSIWAQGAQNSLHRAISWTETQLLVRQALLIWPVSLEAAIAHLWLLLKLYWMLQIGKEPLLVARCDHSHLRFRKHRHKSLQSLSSIVKDWGQRRSGATYRVEVGCSRVRSLLCKRCRHW